MKAIKRGQDSDSFASLLARSCPRTYGTRRQQSNHLNLGGDIEVC